MLRKNYWLVLSLIGLVSCLGCSEEITPKRDYESGLAWLEVDEPAEAVGNFTLALKIDPKHVESLRMRGVAQQRLEKFSEARIDFDEALKLNPKDAKTLAARANLNLEEGLLQEAVADASAAIEINPDLGEAYLYRGKAKVLMDDYSTAIEDVLESNRLSRGSEETTAKTYALLGQIYLHTEEYLEASYNFGLAIDYFDTRIRRFPKHKLTVVDQEEQVWAGKAAYEAGADAYAGRAAALLAQDKVREALSDAKKAVRLDENSDAAFYQRAVALFREKRFFEAKNDLNKAITLNSNRPEYFDLRAWISATCTQEMDRDALTAVQDALRACEMTEHQNANYLETLAAAYAESGNFSKAIQWQHEAIRLAGAANATQRQARLQLYQRQKPFRSQLN